MSSTLIAGLILAGALLLLGIAYLNTLVERHRLTVARQRAELADEARRCASLARSLPGQMLTPPLRLALARLELAWNERLQALDKRNAELARHLERLRALIAQGDAITIEAPVQQILTEAKAKEVRVRLEEFHALFARAAKAGLMPSGEAKRWQSEVRRLLVLMHADLFANLGKLALQQNQPRQARLAYERAVQYLNRQPDVADYAPRLRHLQSQLERANALVLATPKAADDNQDELTAGLEMLADDADWKKKNLYE